MYAKLPATKPHSQKTKHANTYAFVKETGGWPPMTNLAECATSLRPILSKDPLSKESLSVRELDEILKEAGPSSAIKDWVGVTREGLTVEQISKRSLCGGEAGGNCSIAFSSCKMRKVESSKIGFEDIFLTTRYCKIIHIENQLCN